MNDLQIMLIGIGALIIVAVIILNWMQERRFHKQIERSFFPLESDALIDDPKIDVSKLEAAALDINDASGKMIEPELSQGNVDNFEFNQSKVDVYADDLIQNQPYSEEENSANDIPSTTKHSQQKTVIAGHLFAEPSEMEANLTDTAELATSENSANPEVISAKHHDIKAIFNEAFSQNNKTATVQQSELTELGELAESENTATINSEGDQNSSSSDTPIHEIKFAAMLDPKMDLTAVLSFSAEMTVSDLNNQLNGLFDDFDKPVFLHVLTSEPNQQWILLKEAGPKQTIAKISCSLQLADRAGAVSSDVLNRFKLVVENLNTAINAAIEWQDLEDSDGNDVAATIATANALDAFCLEVDKTIGIHLINGLNGAFTGTKLKGLAEAQGLTLAADGTFKRFDDAEKPPLDTHKPRLSFVMFNRDNNAFSPEMLRNSVVKGITFQLDITHVKQSAEAFTQMVQVAKQMETGLNALLVDDNNKALTDAQIEKIRHQLKAIHATMLGRGIVPGSDSALRLFS
jgi:FtsZ-interacting cell division protein ZipA